MYLFFKDGVKIEEIKTKVILSYFDSNLKKKLQYEIPISKEFCEVNNVIYKLGVFKIIKILEDF